MSWVETFFNSNFFQYFVLPAIIIVVLLIVISKLIFNKPIGVVAMEFMGQRPRKLEEIDANAHPRLVEESKHAGKLSKDNNAHWLCLVALDDIHYSTQRGRKVLGRIRGISTYQSRIEVVFKRPWTFKKFIFMAPPDMLLSSPSSKFVLFNGISLKMLNSDFCYPIPAQDSNYNENQLDAFAMHHYEAKIMLASNVQLNPLGETMLLRSASDTSEVRIQREALRQHIWRSDSDVEAQRAAEQSARQPSPFDL